MLKLPAQQALYKKQQVTIQQVQTPDGEAVYPTRDADILLLGDSFSNIYSFGGMNWGEAAGFAEQLSYYLQRPFDAIINNAGGSYVTRQQLARDMARGKDRLRGKRLVIWQFAMRDLLSGDWKLLDLPDVKKKP
jgi:alginate O-acetyltransferase complex protein AlgJ